MLKASEKKLMEKWKGTPIGTEVILTRDNGEVVHTKTRSNPEILSGHSAVIWLEGVSGCYSLRNVQLAPGKKPTIEELEEVIGSVKILPDGTVKPIEPPKFIEPPGVTKVKVEVLEDVLAREEEAGKCEKHNGNVCEPCAYDRGRRDALLDACKEVCCMCGSRALRYEQTVTGPNSAGNYTHAHKDQGDPSLCKASSIWSLIKHEDRRIEGSPTK